MADKPKINITNCEHRQELTAMLKVIYMAPIHDDIKMIMRMRIWGILPSVFSPMTLQQIADHLHAPIEIIEDMEKFGKEHVQKFLLSVSAQDLINKFNSDDKRNKNDMFAKMKYQKKRFTV